MTDVPPLGAAADRLQAATAAFLALGPGVRARGPWPLAAAFGTEPEADWGPPEVLAHVAEMLPFWLGEVERILEGDAAAPVPFGRVATDTVRIGVIGRDRTVPLRELWARIGSDGARVVARMLELDAGEAGRIGLHPRLGEMTVAHLFDRFVVTHIEEHVTQLEATLARRPA